LRHSQQGDAQHESSLGTIIAHPSIHPSIHPSDLTTLFVLFSFILSGFAGYVGLRPVSPVSHFSLINRPFYAHNGPEMKESLAYSIAIAGKPKASDLKEVA
jgi:hypothetical protein